ncbi:tachylectin-related carbohydrate-binding protein [Kutzneria sp. 744]|uniref:tachylectin-related carbohydrate-binding protein n=1 Tax=Kutzneria sp. (strain 744) TaxID=345341 RepID=UPI0003EEBD57|nr:tachylectin-related carbohydrate-binding protein [Kutzneria sp. 744]EWM18504.1 mucin-2 [Kutzneria sp. 744]
MRLAARTSAVVAALAMVTAGAAQAATDSDDAVKARVAQVAAYTTDPCNGAPTAADAAAAGKLNGVLTQGLKGDMTAYRVSCARAVIDAVQKRGLDERAAVIAITTTIVESTIENISEKVDHSSLGLFQQLDSWGTAAQRLNPSWATTKFLDVMEDFYPNGSWRTADIGDVCQRVQRSAFPDRYGKQTLDAQRIVDELSGPGAVTAGIYGALSDGRLTYSTINSATGDRTRTVVSSASLGFVPKALATLNFNTLLVTSPAAQLYRVDIITNSNSLAFSEPTPLGGGWTHDMLTYDGHGHLYGIANGTLMSYVVSRPKPAASQVGQRVVIGDGFTMRTIAATGDDWLIAISTAGVLRSYHIAADNTWTGATLADRWSTFDRIVSPGYGLYYAQTRDGALYRYFDHNPYDLNGSDIEGFGTDPVDTQGWTQIQLSAQPLVG